MERVNHLAPNNTNIQHQVVFLWDRIIQRHSYSNPNNIDVY